MPLVQEMHKMVKLLLMTQIATFGICVENFKISQMITNIKYMCLI